MKIPTLLVTLLLAGSLFSAEKQVPPPGVKIPDADRKELEAGVASLGRDIESLRKNPNALSLLPDVEIFYKAVHDALVYDEIYGDKNGDPKKQIATARDLLKQGAERASELRAGKASWLSATGAVLRGYRSRVDGSVQPYCVVVPPTWKLGDKTPRPLWLWMHGRGENITELSFMSGNKPTTELECGDAFFVRLYGRFCNAQKFAGERDLFEVMGAMEGEMDPRPRKNPPIYAIDTERVVVCGFSMGGASTWHIATHHAGWWVAASPGAGFAETAIYQNVFAPGKEPPPWYEQVLWRFYDATDYAANLANTHLVAYSGGIDPQKASADLMEKVMAGEGLKLERFVGPNTGHKYEPNTKKELEKRLQEIVAKGGEAMPAKVHLTTYTTRFNIQKWITVNELEQHWMRADIDAEYQNENHSRSFRVTTKNIAAFSIAIPPLPGPYRIVIDGQEISGLSGEFRKTNGKWENDHSRNDGTPSKHGRLSGPIDDAFMDSFIFVRPTGKPLNDKVGGWAKSELDRAIVEWRRVFRGEAPVKNDSTITAQDIANSNLVLWGDPSSNALLAKILPNLPIRWDATTLVIGNEKFSAADHAPVLIFPNPLNPNRYVVLNSSFTFREGASVSNSQQTPKLPDWAIVDLRTPPSAHLPGAIEDAGFFGEHWEFTDNTALKNSVKKN